MNHQPHIEAEHADIRKPGRFDGDVVGFQKEAHADETIEMIAGTHRMVRGDRWFTVVIGGDLLQSCYM